MQKRAKKTTNQTRGQLDKHDFGKKLKNLGKKQKEREKKQIRPGTSWTNMISGKSCKSLGKCTKKRKKQDKSQKKGKTTMQKKANKKQIRPVICIFLHCVFAPASFLHF